MPMSESFKSRIFPVLDKITSHFQTPFHIYDETGIRETGRRLQTAFSGIDSFKEFYAVKALPNPKILKIMQSMGFGFDCSSITELQLCREIGAHDEDIMFTSNNTSHRDFMAAKKSGGCILNLDDINLINKVPNMPDLISFRYNPGARRTGNDIIGNPLEAKYGVSHEQIINGYRMAKEKGAGRFGIHTMVASNELNHTYMVQTAQMLLELIAEITDKLDIQFEFINIGGGLGIPYQPDIPGLNLEEMGRKITLLFNDFKKLHGYVPALFMESGRFMTGPHGVLITTVINRKDIYRTYIGVDASMSALMRPALYRAYHHIDVLQKVPSDTIETVDVTGSLCENNDKFAVQRELPFMMEDDILVIHDTGAHGHSMGFNYNGNLRPKELLLTEDNRVEMIRREEYPVDYFATLQFEKDTLSL